MRPWPARPPAGDAHSVVAVLTAAAALATAAASHVGAAAIGAGAAAAPGKAAAAAASTLQLSPVEVDGALASTVAGNLDRWPALAVLAALRRKGLADSSATLAAVARAARSRKGAAAYGANDDDDDGSGSDNDGASRGAGDVAPASATGAARSSTLAFLDALRAPQTYTAAAFSRTARADALLRVDYGILSPSGPRIAAVAALARRHAVVTSLPALAQCPFLCLVDGTVEALLEAAATAAAAAASSAVAHPPASPFDGSSQPATPVAAASTGGELAALLPMAVRPSAAVHLDVVFLGGTVDPEPAPPLLGAQAVQSPLRALTATAAAPVIAVPSALPPSPPLPLGLNSLQRWLGSVVPAAASALASLLRGGSGDAGARREDEDDEDGRGADLGLGGGPETVLHATVAAHLAAMGKRRLRPLPRGAEDAVVGYWRFERSEDETAAEKTRERELRRAGRWGPKAPPADTAAGLWGVAQVRRGVRELRENTND